MFPSVLLDLALERYTSKICLCKLLEEGRPVQAEKRSEKEVKKQAGAREPGIIHVNSRANSIYA